VPAAGEPIVLMADCGTIGGYPKIATVISVDLGQLAQFAPGTEFIFDEVSVEKAPGLLREQEQMLGQLADSIKRI
jgi:allophanate hydrolase subunit 2